MSLEININVQEREPFVGALTQMLMITEVYVF